MVVPLSLPRARLPRIVSMDSNTVWHTSALLSTAMETAGLPTRLSLLEQNTRSNFGDIVSSLNLAGGQTIGRLQLSVSEAFGGRK